MQQARKDRWLYRIACTLLLLLLFVVVFGSYIMPHHVDHDHRLLYDWQVVDGVKKRVHAPFAPSDRFWLGTDHRGYDLLSLLINGAKYTFFYAFLVTVLRFAVGLPIGLWAGVTGRFRQILSTLQMVTSSVPPLLFIFPTMYGLKLILPPADREPILFFLLVLFGVFQVAHQFSERAAFYNDKLFITASRLMGASPWRLVFRHLTPHLRPEILFAFLTEMVQVLFLFGQLAVVNIFIGGGEVFEITDASTFTKAVTIELTTSGEWGGLIAYGIQVMRVYPWIVLYAGAFFTAGILILSFYANQLQKRLANPLVYRSLPFVQNKPRLVLVGAVAAACLLLVILSPNKAPQPHIDNGKPQPFIPVTGDGQQ
jgi:peptide/nickel transport system permease protein